MLRLVVTRSAMRQPASYSRAFATSAPSRVKILGSDDAYTQIATVRLCSAAVHLQQMTFDVYERPKRRNAKYPEIEFAKVDVDELNDTTAKAGVRSMPTFFAFSDGKLQRGLSFSGADEALLRDNINQLNEL